ncbi:MAG: DUF4129 domain-containing protein [Gemmatimonadota bacterium]
MPPQLPADSLRSVLDTVFAAPAYQWVEPPRPFAFLSRWWDLLSESLARFREASPLLFQWFFWALILALVLIFVHAAYILVQTMHAAAAPRDVHAGSPGVERRDARWYRRQADRLAMEGRFAEAIQSAFLALVLELDARRVVRFQPSKTPNEYTYEAQLPEAERERLRALVRSLYSFAFARVPCNVDDYRAWMMQAAEEWHAPAH